MLRSLTQKKPLFACLIAMVCLSLASMYTFRDKRLQAVYLARGNNGTPQLKKQKYESVQSRAFLEPNPKRTNIVILSLPRSGSSFLGDVFNHHPQVLYLFEPLHSLQLKIQDNSLFHFDFTRDSYGRSVSKFLDEVMSCKFVDGEFARNIHVKDRYRSFALTSRPFCSGNGTSRVCQDVDPVKLEALCKHNYSVVSLKILTPRVPDAQSKGHLLPSCNSYRDSECKIIHIVRDPRAVIASLLFSVNFFSRRWETRRPLDWYVEEICHQLESDVTVGKLTGNSLGSRYKLIRFEDLARQPFSQINELFKFVGIKMTDGVREWLNEATHSSGVSHTNFRQAYDTSRDSEKVVSSWRTRIKSATVQIIERYCGKVMGQLGYKLTGMSPERQLNLNISLIDPMG